MAVLKMNTDHGSIGGLMVIGISSAWSFIGDNHHEITVLICLAGLCVQIWSVRRKSKIK